MDRERNAARLADWRARGNTTALQPTLMAESELLPFYRRDFRAEMAALPVSEVDAGRGQRVRTQVTYSDGLTDDQFLNALEDSDDDVEDASERKRIRVEKREARKRANDALAEAEASGVPLGSARVKEVMQEALGGVVAGTDASSSGSQAGGEGVGKKKRGRPSTSETPSVVGDDTPVVSNACCYDSDYE
jgi:ATP-dependent helicase STH1/SNF2